jgi:outer membrane protein assembly factor BamB
LLWVLWLLPALAQAQEAWSVVLVEGSAVMGETSTLTFEARNASTSTQPISQIVFAFPAGYTLQGGTGPARWVPWRIDNTNRSIAFYLDGNTCKQPYQGLAPGESARFQVKVVAPQAGADVTDALIGAPIIPYKTTHATEACQGKIFKGEPDPSKVLWPRRGLSASLSVTPRTLQPGQDVTVQLAVTNRSSQEQTGISPSPPEVLGNAAFSLVQPFTPPSLSLPVGGTGTFSARLRATSGGTSTFRASARNATPVSSAAVSSPSVDVSDFAALAELSPLDVVSGDTVTVHLTVSNPTATTYQGIVPRAPLFQGSATATLLSGPTPASLASLPSRASGSFTWTYRITGAVKSTFLFQLRADATRSSAPISTNLVSTAQGAVAEHKLRINPVSIRAGTSGQALQYTVFNGGSTYIGSVLLLPPDPALFTVSMTPFAADTSGWSAKVVGDPATGKVMGYEWTAPNSGAYLQSGQQKTFTLNYDAVASVASDTVSTQTFELRQAPNWKKPLVEASVTLKVPRSVFDVQDLVAMGGPSRNTLLWSNPEQHDGVLVLRSIGAPPGQAPAHGRRYNVGETLGNATILYADERSVVSSYEDAALTPGTVYYYRVFNHYDLYQYSPGSVPTSQGLKSIPTGRTAGEPLWCYSVGMPALMQPVTEPGVGIFSGNNAGSITANLTHTTQTLLDGGERWRPVHLQGAVQSRFPIVPLHGLPGQYLFTGDQEGFTYGIRADTGQLFWRGNGGESLGIIQSFPVVQLYDYANATYRAAYPGRDLVFFATRLSSGTDNKVVALDAHTGAPVWTYAPGDLGMVSGGMLIDYTYNRLFVGAHSNGGTLDSLRVLDSLTGNELARLKLGDVDYGLTRLNAQLLVTSSDGRVFGLDVAAMTVAWSTQVATPPSASTPAFSSFVRPVSGGFLASIQGASAAEGRVERWSISGTTLTRVWSTPLPGPSGAFSITLGGVTRIYVGTSDSRLHELSLTTGVSGRQVSLPGAGVMGTPTVDASVGRLHVGTQDGRICAFPVPFP